MGEKLTGKELALYKTIDEILWNDWDPIGVNDFGEDARDEYYSYLPKVYTMVNENFSAQEIGQYLFKVEFDMMGMPSTLERCILIAEKILKEKQKIKQD